MSRILDWSRIVLVLPALGNSQDLSDIEERLAKSPRGKPLRTVRPCCGPRIRSMRRTVRESLEFLPGAQYNNGTGVLVKFIFGGTP
jgi:hypothetical protein